MVDCGLDWSLNGCEGGGSLNALRYIYHEKINRDIDYPYDAKDNGSCLRKQDKDRYTITDIRIPKGYSHDAYIEEL